MQMEWLALSHTLKEIGDWAGNLFRKTPKNHNPHLDWFPIKLALLATAQLYQQFLPHPDLHQVRQLLDGGEPHEPNLNTRLRYIRDLCSASTYFFKMKGRNSSDHSLDPVTMVQTPGEKVWSAWLANEVPESANVQELARLLDDVLEAMLCVYYNLLLLEDHDQEAIFDEVHRHLTHVVGHFDYAEEFLIEAMHPAPD